MNHRKLIATGLALVAAVMLTPRPAKALFGEDIALLIKQFAELIKMYNSLRSVETMYKNAFTYFPQQVKWGWRGMITNGINVYTQNHFGETIPWNDMHQAMSPAMAQGAWGGATIPLMITDAPLTRNTIARLASVETSDSAGINGLAAIEQSRQTRHQMDTTASRWESDALSGSHSYNTQVEQLNALNGGTALSLHYQQLMVVNQESQEAMTAVMVKQKRDEIAEQLNHESQRQQFAIQYGYGLGTCVSCTVREVHP